MARAFFTPGALLILGRAEGGKREAAFNYGPVIKREAHFWSVVTLLVKVYAASDICWSIASCSAEGFYALASMAGPLAFFFGIWRLIWDGNRGFIGSWGIQGRFGDIFGCTLREMESGICTGTSRNFTVFKEKTKFYCTRVKRMVS